MDNNKYYTRYKGWWYKYIPAMDDSQSNMWRLANRQDELDWVLMFNANELRLDQCFDKIKDFYKWT